MMVHQKINSPVGPLHLVADGEKLCAIYFDRTWASAKKRFRDLQEGPSPALRQTKRQLGEYFNGKRTSFDLPLELSGTKFQKRVWSLLAEIPLGQTRTYKEHAIAARSPKAARAVGRANGLNPLCIVLPCHRVVGGDGSLTGFAGGLAAKKFLLDFERSRFDLPGQGRSSVAAMK